jgi:hypothetical protein
MSFIVQISPFVHLFTLKIVYRWEVLHQGSARTCFLFYHGNNTKIELINIFLLNMRTFD